MNIYHIVFDDCDYDEYDSFVVIAENEESAIEIIKPLAPKESSIDEISCIGVSNRSEREIVIGSFNAG